MRLSTRGRYAVMAMVELATRQAAHNAQLRRGGHCPVSLAEIAQAQQLSLAYLEQLFGHLRRAGLVCSARGPGGGYRLARAPAAIAVAEIVEAVDEKLKATRCEEGMAGCLAGQKCLTHDLWQELGEQIRLFLAHVTLADVCCGGIAGRAAPPLPPRLPEPVSPAE
ncbi:Rrf2 family transcriptional regulator [Siccirubricoccus phaeus]|uniref:Rrf2 family transcriptional regulator n=1 Tax=Siccirubricoccus phaeus TaxID=2595053 RepID=UPI0011F3D89D|nr:Rrf2 family transcriptional regulator [Siccirubricoccus phaeus]